MSFWQYIKDGLIKGLLYAVFVMLVISVLVVFKTNMAAVWCVVGLFVFFGVALVMYDYWRKRDFYNGMRKILDGLDRKYLLGELLDEPRFLEGRLMCGALYEAGKAMTEEVSDSRRYVDGYRDYVEMWVHEIKTPLAGLGLSLRKESRETKIYLEEMANYIEQALYYSKIDTVDKDYVVKQVKLSEIVKVVVKNGKDSLIKNGVKVVMRDLDVVVNSDAKWLEFILNQIVVNAVKYRKDDPKIEIFAEQGEGRTLLKVRDEGIGIKKSELKRVFEKGFTGSNDRKVKVSTGMGLYIADRLAKELGHKLRIDSMEGEWTEVSVEFGKEKFFEVRE